MYARARKGKRPFQAGQFHDHCRQVAELIAAALTGGARLGFLPNLLMWAALVAGSLLGAFGYHWINLASIWFAAGFALALSAIVALTVHR
jgi:uncharacterized membrane protein YoaK (UPF0700 family)